MHSVLDFELSLPRCIVRRNLAKCLFSWVIASWSSWKFWKRKKLLSTKKEVLNSKGFLLAKDFWLRSLPL
jgi:hypothetical protein